MFLDYRKFLDFLNEHYSSGESIKARLVGTKRDYDSGYFDIIRFFGSDAIDPQDVKIKYLPDQYELKDQLIEKFAREIENELKEQGRMYDGPFVSRAILDGFCERIILQKCRYGTFAGSCFALDEENDIFEEYRTLRNYYINQKYSGLEDHPLALCLGICGVLIFRDQNKKKCLLMERSGNLASLENSIGPSAAGTVDYTEKYKTLVELIVDALGSEIQEELNLTSEEYEITPLAYAREIFRGEKPQIFCMIKSTLSQKEISDRLDSIQKPEEFKSYQFVDLDDIIFQKIKPNHEALMNCFLIEEYLDKNK